MAFNIEGFIGANGGGKSLAIVECKVLPAWREGRCVVSNMTLRPEAAGFDPELFVPLTTWRQIPLLSHALLVLDEINAVLPSRASTSSMPLELGRMLNQLRKPDVRLVWSAPSWKRADVILREVTQAVTVCRGFLPDRWQREDGCRRFPRRLVGSDGRPVRVDGWANNRLFGWSTYDAIELDEFTAGARDRMKPKAVKWWWRPGKLAPSLYDTHDQVGLSDHLDQFGTCGSCGGARQRVKCRCVEVPGAGEARAEPGARRLALSGAEVPPTHPNGGFS